MKKGRWLGIVLVTIAMAVMALSCGKPGEKKVDAEQDWKAYFPLAEGYEWIYHSRVKGLEDFDYKIKVTGRGVVKGCNCYVVQVDAEMYKETDYYEITDGAVLTHRRGIGDDIKDLDPPAPLLRFPLKQGKRWKWSGPGTGSSDAKEVYTVEGQEEVVVPAGTFKAYRVKLRYSASNDIEATIVQWYARDVGMVKEKIEGKTVNILSELKGYDFNPDKD